MRNVQIANYGFAGVVCFNQKRLRPLQLQLNEPAAGRQPARSSCKIRVYSKKGVPAGRGGSGRRGKRKQKRGSCDCLIIVTFFKNSRRQIMTPSLAENNAVITYSPLRSCSAWCSLSCREGARPVRCRPICVTRPVICNAHHYH